MPKSTVAKSNNNKKKNAGGDKSRAFKMFFVTLIVSVLFSVISQKTFTASENILVPLLTILIIILIGVIFDIIGIAVTATPETPFVSMSAKKIRGAKEALRLIKNADVVSNFCNDVVGDICGIISGSAGGMLVIRISTLGLKPDYMTIILSSLIAGVTVGGKAFGKGIAINNGQEIVHSVGYLLSFLAKPSKKDKSMKKKEA